MYTHTAEGQIFAVEQETGRLLWRRYYPGVFICYTSPLFYRGRLLVPQAGLKKCRLRCLAADTGKLLWEAPFSGSPSWNRQAPPVIHNNLAIYAFSTGRYAPERWLVGHGEIKVFPKDQKPLVRAYDLSTGKTVWPTSRPSPSPPSDARVTAPDSSSTATGVHPDHDLARSAV